MIVQCDQCNAKFRLDDSKVKEGGAKVRCSKCKHIFVVRKETPAEEADFDSLLSGLASPPVEPAGKESTAGEPAPVSGAPSGGDISIAVEQRAEDRSSEGDSFDFDEFAFGAEPVSAPPAAPAGSEEKDEFAFGERDIAGDESAGTDAPLPGGDERGIDDTAFTFDEEPAAVPAPEFDVDIEGLGGPAAGEPSDFGTVSPPEHEKAFSSPPAMEFSFEEEETPPQAVAPPSPEPAKEAGHPTSFDFDEFKFGEAESSEQPAQEEAKPGEPATWEWDGEEPKPQSLEHEAAPPFEVPVAADELPPLSISSRRKGSSAVPIVAIGVAVLLVLALAGGGVYVFKQGPAAFDKVGLGFMAKWFGLETREEGGIAISNAAAAFQVNTQAGEIFVVTGEAVNNFGRPRASIQVRATLYGPKGEAFLQKTAYCGNSLSKDQLTTLPMAKLDSAMGNQFGDSLSNLAVQPGKGIPFTVVFANVPQGATDFGVEVVGSTVASQ